MNKTFIHILLSLMVGLSVILTACQPAVTTEETAPENEAEPEVEPSATSTVPPTAEPEEEEAEVAMGKDIQLDPATIKQEELLEISSYIYEGLVKLEDDTVTPSLATTWTVSDDKLDYIFELRPNVAFHDGTLLDADLVIENFNRWFDTNHSLHGTDKEYTAWLDVFGGFEGEVDSDGVPLSSFDGIEKVNNLIILIHLNEQVPDLLQKLAQTQFSIINTELLAVEGDLYGTPSGSTIGTGPYIVDEWKDGSISLLPNSEYWDTPPEDNLEFSLP